MSATVGAVTVELAAFVAAAYTIALELCHALLQGAVGNVGKGVARCLRTGVTLVLGDPSQSAVAYAPAAVAGVLRTYEAVFYNKSSWTWLAFLDVGAIWAVARRHSQEHAEAAAAASLRAAAADPANTATSRRRRPGADELALLRCAAVHAKAAYGAPAASGHVSSAAGFLKVVTVHQATSRAPRRIPAAEHLAAVQSLTGCAPSDVLAAQWQAHHHLPAFYVALDRRRRCVVVSVRGTLQLGDFCTVLNAKPAAATLCGVHGHVHAGFLAAARNLLPAVAAALHAAAASCPGLDIVCTGHSLGGGVAAVLTLLLREAGGRLGLHDWRALGEPRCVGVGAAAALCRQLGGACHGHVTSLLYGADCLPMFSALGARLLISEVQASSRAAASLASLARRLGLAPRQPSSQLTGATSADRGSAAGLAEIEEAAAAAAGSPTRGLRRCPSSLTSSSTSSLSAFASDSGPDEAAGLAAAGLVPMYPPGRILWMLPSSGGDACKGGGDELALYETDASAFQRFLVTLETSAHHLPDSYIAALGSLARQADNP